MVRRKIGLWPRITLRTGRNPTRYIYDTFRRELCWSDESRERPLPVNSRKIRVIPKRDNFEGDFLQRIDR